MNLISKKLILLCLLVPMLGVTGCATVGGGGDGVVMGDLLTERAVVRAIYNEPNLTGDPILVGCVDGVITLNGTVDSDVERQLAERVARSIDGVTDVNNNLRTTS